VLLANAFDTFLVEADMGVEIAAVLDTVNTAEMHTVEHASEKIQTLILNASMPVGIADEIKGAHTQLGAEFVAVRSSATAEDSASAAWAGQLDSFLNTTKDTLLKNVQKCWASLFTPRAIFYRFENALHTQKISVAVVVQGMVQSEVSGIAFSVHPVTQDRNQLIIEAGYGLGEAIVSGQITPDSYVVTKHPLEIIDKNISTQDRMLIRSANGGSGWVSCSPPQEGELDGVIENSVVVADVTATSPNPSSRGGGKSTMPQKLSDIQIFELSRLIVQIENHYGFPCDIEWAWADGQFYITQSRPITTLVANSGDNGVGQDINSADYIATFKASGVSILYADMVNTMYLPYDPLIYI
jgi:pyruvate,water dikinase